MTSSAPHRYPTLDLLRLVAIGMTILLHTNTLLIRIPLLRTFGVGFWLGVDLFMLISGWLLAGQLLRDAASGRFAPLRFYAKRWMRTLPPYYVMLAVLYFGHGKQFSAPLPIRVIVEHLLFLQQYFGDNNYPISWSLCVEEHFYLCLPLIVALLVRKPHLAVLLALVAAQTAISLICRMVTYPTTTETVPILSHLRCDGLFVGMMLAWINVHRPAVWRAFGRFADGIGLVGIAVTLGVMATMPAQSHKSPWLFVAGPLVGTWALALVFLPCVHEGSRWSRVKFPGLKYLGELTYSLYLVHDVIPTKWYGGGHAGTSGVTGICLRLVLTVGLSIALHHLVERPALNIRERVLLRWRGAERAHETTT